MTLTDAPVRERISRTALDELLFVEAGAGTGKTSQLVGRVHALVCERGVPMREIAAITFTEAAAGELRTRVREALERTAHAPPPDRPDLAARADAALRELDGAAIGTLHSFAQRILSEHPVDAGLPPAVEVLDEVESLLEFDARWREHVDLMFADPELASVVALAHLLDLRVDHARQASLRDVATVFADNWDRLGPLSGLPVAAPGIDRDACLVALRALDDVFARCAEIPDDRLAAWLLDRRQEIDGARFALERGSDRTVLRVLGTKRPRWVHRNLGQATAWGGKEAKAEVVATMTAAEDAVEALIATTADAVLRVLAGEVARFTERSAERRRRSGRLDFHDLLVLARALLRESPTARRALHRRYTRLLIDEFQDTDPIQIELATLIAASAADLDPDVDWAQVQVDPERLFFVGDPKQSIYRFRRADIELFLAARRAFAGSVERLSTNFRTVPTVLGWVNAVFGRLMADEVEGRSPRYEPLHAHREEQGADHRVVLLGEPHAKEERLRAGPLRELEAATVAGAVAGILAEPEAWPVDDGAGGWRPARPEDIAILVPTRTSLPALMDALRARDVEFRSETGTLVYETQEVRDLLSILRAVASGSDAVALVAALRSPILGCGDDDLLTFHHAGGRWDPSAPRPDLPADHPVMAALAYLDELRADRWWTPPSVLLDRVVRERRVMTLALAGGRARDTWRRLRFLVDQARAFEASQSADLVAFVRWAELQRSDMARVHEPVLPESDDHAVRILTVHGAKGLEFPITVLSGLTTQLGRRRNRCTVHWSDDDIEVSARKDLRTEGFDRLADLEAEMDDHEKLRLLYVACTRARDHLLVATHHVEGAKSFARMVWDAAQEAAPELWRVDDPSGAPPVPRPAPVADAPDPGESAAREEWARRRDEWLASGRRRRVVSATEIRGLGDAAPEAPPPVVDGPGWRRGRGATAFGRAVHAVLEDVDLGDPAAIESLAGAAARAEGLPEAAAEVAAVAAAVWGAPAVRDAATRPTAREVYVAAPVGDRVVEGYVDLLVRRPDGLRVVDYKTDRPGGPDASERYRRQLAAYAAAIEAATGEPVVDGVLVYGDAGGARETRFDRSELAPEAVGALLAGL